MNKQYKVVWFMNNKDFFPQSEWLNLQKMFGKMTDEEFTVVSGVVLKDPALYVAVSVFWGELGVDRFILGDVGMGILKLLTGGVFGILWLIDAIRMKKIVQERNYKAIVAAYNMCIS